MKSWNRLPMSDELLCRCGHLVEEHVKEYDFIGCTVVESGEVCECRRDAVHAAMPAPEAEE